MADLFAALKSNDAATVNKILLKNPELVNYPECVDKDGASLLWKAMLDGHENAVETLVRDFKVDPDEKCRMKNVNFAGWTYLEYLAKCDSECTPRMLRVAEILIRHGADVNAIVELEPDECAWTETLLKVAVWYGKLQFVELLLKSCVEFRVKNTYVPYCDTIMSHILKRKKNRKEMLLLFLSYGLGVSEHVKSTYRKNIVHNFIYRHVSSEDEDAVEIVKILIERLRDEFLIDGTDDCKSISPLHYAIMKQNVPLITFFIENRANVNQQKRNYYGSSPLMEAMQLKRFDVIRLLISRGADVNAETIFNDTALHFACCMCSRFDENLDKNFETQEKIIRLLLQRGAAISVLSKSGATPFSTLISSSTSDCCIRLMIREFSKVSFANGSICSKDMDILHANPRAREYFEMCLAELEHMAIVKFYNPYSYYSVLKMSKNIKKLALLAKNAKFLATFEANLDCFSYYKNDLREILKEASEVRDELIAVESRLKYIFGNFFPDVVLRSLADNLTAEDLPEPIFVTEL